MSVSSFLNDNALPFGSRIWGGSTPDSDYDFLLHPDKQEELLQVLTSSGTPYRLRESKYVQMGIELHIEFNRHQVSIPFESNYQYQVSTIALLNELFLVAPLSLVTKNDRINIFESTLLFIQGTAALPHNMYPPEFFPELNI